ncbi:hypothetical protein JCM10908_004561 [Rhodotorula pacifica]|uniref:uncharacterized protein n=1 Tax=Rhodotorula pacifica TaxID=1495444 RepID=UPI00316CE4BE
MQTRRKRRGEGATASTAGHIVQPGLVRDPSALESIATTLQTWSPFGTADPRRVAGKRTSATASTSVISAAVGSYNSDLSSGESDDAPPHVREVEDDATTAARRAVGSSAADAVAWAKWDDLVTQGRSRRVLLIGYRSGGIALWDCSDLDNFVELLHLPSAAFASDPATGHKVKKRDGQIVDGAVLATSAKTADDEPVLVLLSRPPSRAPSPSSRSHLVFYSLRKHVTLGRVAVPGLAHQLELNRRFLVVSTSAPLALHTFHRPSFDSGEVKLSPTASSPIRDVAPSSFDGAPVFSLGSGGRLLAYATSTPVRSSRLGGLPAKPGHGILARPGSFDNKSASDVGTSRVPLALADAPDVARRVSEGVLGGVSALKDAGMSYWAQAQGRGSREASPSVHGRSPTSSQGSPLAYARSAPTGKAHAMSPRASECSSVVVLDLLRTSGDSNGASSLKRNGTSRDASRHDTPVSPPRIVASFSPSAEPIAQLSFSPSSTHLLVAADGAHAFDVFELKPTTAIGQSAISTGPAADSGANVWHRYRLERGITSAHARDITWSSDGRLVAVSTTKGTSHVYAIHPAGGLPQLEKHFGPRVTNSNELPPLSLSVRAAVRVRPASANNQDLDNPAAVAATSAKTLAARVAFMPRSATATSVFASDEDPALALTRSKRSRAPLEAQDFLVFRPDSGNATLHRLTAQEVVASPSLTTTTTNAVAAASRGEIGKLATTAVSGLTQLMRSRGSNLVGGSMPAPPSGRDEANGATEKAWRVRCRSLAGWDLRKGQDWPEVREVISAPVSGAPSAGKSRGDLHSASAEIETSSRAPRVLPRSIYASRQFDFFALPPGYEELSAAGFVDVGGREIHFRPEVRVRQGVVNPSSDSISSKATSKQSLRAASDFAPASFDQPIKSAMHTFLDPQTILAPGSPQLRPPTFPNGVPGKHGSWRDSIQIPRGVAPAAMEGIERVRQSLGHIRVPKGMIPVGRRGSLAGASASDLQAAYSTSISFEDEDAVFADRELAPSQSVSTACTTDLDEGHGTGKAGQRDCDGDFDRTLRDDWDDGFVEEEDALKRRPTVGDSPESAIEATIGEFEHFELELPLVPSSSVPAVPTLAVPSPFALDPVDAGDDTYSARSRDGTSFPNTPKDNLPTSRLTDPASKSIDLLDQTAEALAGIPIVAPKLAVPTNVAHSSSPSSVSSSPSTRSSGKRKGRR